MSSTPPTTGSHPTHKTKIRWWWWALFLGGLLVSMASAIIWVGSLNTADGDPLLENPGALLSTLIGGVTSIVGIIVGKLNAIGGDTAQTKNHVVNSHGDIILRDDLDEIKSDMKRVLHIQATQGVDLSDMRRDMLGVREELSQIRKTEREQWDAIEETASKVRGNRGERK